jgi:hypothetical protein
MIARNSNSPLPLAQIMIIGPQTDIVNGGGGGGILEIFEKSTISRLISYSILITRWGTLCPGRV